MTQSAEESKNAKADLASAKARAKALRPWYQKKRFIVPIALFVIIVFSNSLNSGAPDRSPTTVIDETEQPAVEEEQSTETVNQQNARQKAESYLNSSAFSRQGLIEQLEYEGFSAVDAEYGTDAVNADWMEQAALKAAQYLNSSAFSRQGLIEQLEFEGFSAVEAEYGTDAVNADWMEQAALKAAQYLNSSSFSKQGLIDQLLFEGFSQEQAEYGVSTTGLS